MKVAVVGATGLVGTRMLEVLAERNFPVTELLPVASAKSVGRKITFQGKEWTVVSAEDAIAARPDLALFSAGGGTSAELAPKFAAVGTRVVDNSSQWRMDPTKKLVVPEINGDVLEADDYIIANPNCSTIQMLLPLWPLHKDDEVRENAQTEPKQRTWRRFGEIRTHRGADYGVAMHTLMQYVRFDCCTDLEGLEAEIRRLSDARVIPAELAPRLDRSAILAFFRTEPGKKLMTGKYIREFKFSILEDADSYGEGLSGEQILLQGVVDCALVDEDGITVIDFKTDYVTDATLPEVLARYRPQVDTYSRALERIYEMPVKGTYLYFFHLKKLIAV